jgi:hypothetical protein
MNRRLQSESRSGTKTTPAQGVPESHLRGVIHSRSGSARAFAQLRATPLHHDGRPRRPPRSPRQGRELSRSRDSVPHRRRRQLVEDKADPGIGVADERIGCSVATSAKVEKIQSCGVHHTQTAHQLGTWLARKRRTDLLSSACGDERHLGVAFVHRRVAFRHVQTSAQDRR